MGLSDALSPECVKVPLTGDNKEAAMMELVDLLGAAGRIRDVDEAKRAIWKREMTRSTGIGRGVAIPHGKITSGDRLALAVGKPERPVDFQSVDGKPVGVIFLMVSPVDQTGPHIQAMARIARLMDSTEFRNAVMESPDAASLYDLIRMVETQESFAKTMGV